jgi:predicted O-linked N-acetylglucosamine transferase (SPINDLY family)
MPALAGGADITALVLLRAVGLPDLVTENAGDFERLAVTMATDPAALAAVKKRPTRTCPLFNTDFFAAR